MSIEIRNFQPSNSSTNINPNATISFNVVATNQYIIDITNLQIAINTESKIIPGEINSNIYTLSSDSLNYSGYNSYFNVSVVSEIPFEEGQNVTVIVNVDGTDDFSDYYVMPEYVSTFTTRYNGAMSDFRYAFIDSVEKIPVYNELLRKNDTSNPDIFDSAYSRWNNDKSLKIRVNQVLFKGNDVNFGHSIDYEKGLVKFNTALAYNDEVDASYTFRFFSDDEINSFFKMATAQWNMSPPFGGASSIYSTNGTLSGILMIGASVFAYRELLMRLSLQEMRIIFDNASWGDGWKGAQEIFRALMESSEKMFEKAMEAKKVKLPNIGIIVEAQASLPGGRCLIYNDLCEVANKKYMNFDSMFNAIDEGRNVNVATLNEFGEKIFHPILCIEDTGKKDVYGASVSFGKGKSHKIKTVFASGEHKFDTPLGMVRLNNLQNGDKVFVEENESKNIGRISDIGYYGREQCYDIEVPKYHKFLCNDISLSNSRMFRYLYK